MRKITKIDIITRPGKLEELKEALNSIGVAGMTVSPVSYTHLDVYKRQVLL